FGPCVFTPPRMKTRRGSAALASPEARQANAKARERKRLIDGVRTAWGASGLRGREGIYWLGQRVLSSHSTKFPQASVCLARIALWIGTGGGCPLPSPASA